MESANPGTIFFWVFNLSLIYRGEFSENSLISHLISLAFLLSMINKKIKHALKFQFKCFVMYKSFFQKNYACGASFFVP
jgi:hypothetical protein